MTRTTIALTAADAELHRRQWADFGRIEIATGGPDPHLAMTVEAARDLDDTEAAWRAACYVAPYGTSSAAVIAHHWPSPDDVLGRLDGFDTWIRDNSHRIHRRRERRAVYSAERLGLCLVSAAAWITDTLPGIRSEPFEILWRSIDRDVLYVGRYAAIKLLEVLHRMGVVDAPSPDIRPASAWSPRLTLSYLYPEHATVLNSAANTPDVLALADGLAADAGDLVSAVADRTASPFDVEVLLCNYRQVIDRKYPGRPHDSELAIHRDMVSKWGPELDDWSRFYELRAALFPPECLGEISGWDGLRDELGDTHRLHGYLWSDLTYDYVATTDLADPVRR